MSTAIVPFDPSAAMDTAVEKKVVLDAVELHSQQRRQNQLKNLSNALKTAISTENIEITSTELDDVEKDMLAHNALTERSVRNVIRSSFPAGTTDSDIDEWLREGREGKDFGEPEDFLPRVSDRRKRAPLYLYRPDILIDNVICLIPGEGGRKARVEQLVKPLKEFSDAIDQAALEYTEKRAIVHVGYQELGHVMREHSPGEAPSKVAGRQLGLSRRLLSDLLGEWHVRRAHQDQPLPMSKQATMKLDELEGQVLRHLESLGISEVKAKGPEVVLPEPADLPRTVKETCASDDTCTYDVVVKAWHAQKKELELLPRSPKRSRLICLLKSRAASTVQRSIGMPRDQSATNNASEAGLDAIAYIQYRLKRKIEIDQLAGDEQRTKTRRTSVLASNAMRKLLLRGVPRIEDGIFDRSLAKPNADEDTEIVAKVQRRSERLLLK